MKALYKKDDLVRYFNGMKEVYAFIRSRKIDKGDSRYVYELLDAGDGTTYNEVSEDDIVDCVLRKVDADFEVISVEQFNEDIRTMMSAMDKTFRSES